LISSWIAAGIHYEFGGQLVTGREETILYLLSYL